jgi:hypothetical protein
MKKSIKQLFTLPVCLVLSLILLTGSLTALAMSGSPYTTLKKAALDTMFATNGTTRSSVQLFVNGELVDYDDESYTQFSETASLSQYRWGFFYNDPKYSVSNIETEDGQDWYSVYLNPEDVDHLNSSYGPMSGLTRDDNTVRFMELFADLIVGDLKNNLALSEADGIKTISGTLNASQIPEIYNAGLSLLFTRSQANAFITPSDVNFEPEPNSTQTQEEIELRGKTKIVRVYEVEWGDVDEYGYPEWKNQKLISERQTEATPEDYFTSSNGDIFSMPMESARIEYAGGSAQVGQDGYLSAFDGTVRLTTTSIFGDQYEIEIIMSMSSENMGTTEVICPIPGIGEIFTRELFDSLNEQNPDDYYYGSSLYFRLNADGTVDKDSITSEYNYNESLSSEMLVPFAVETTIETTIE